MLNESLAYDSQLREKRNENTAAYATDKSYFANSDEFLCKIRGEDRLLPIITLVIYWGDKKWDGATNLTELLDFSDIDEELKKYVSNHTIHFIHIDEITNLKNFKTEIRHTIGLYNYRNNLDKFQDYIKENKQELSHLDTETLFTISNLISEKKLSTLQSENEEQEETNMCKALDDMRKLARMEGKLEGKNEHTKELIQKKLAKGKSISMIADELEETVEEIERFLKVM